jgi:septal ring factor EnvC (AmiA/AmiB activator)
VHVPAVLKCVRQQFVCFWLPAKAPQLSCCALQQTDLRLLKEKCKRKQAILVRQEEELGARDTALAAAQRDAAALGHTRDSLAAEVGSLQADNAELRAKLEESRQQLQSNEQMIRWLNQQVCCGRFSARCTWAS